MKKNITCFAFVIMASLVFTVACKKGEAPKEEAPVTGEALKPLVILKVSVDPKQKPVAFEHTSHKKRAAAMGKNCKTCHHIGKINDKCSNKGCHFGPGAEKLVHKKCYGECHLTAAAAPKQAQCAGCHK
ncbi:MAG: cytochrome c3 family protein [Spirochaetes bacterium]|nr:cytochrome c3 family protein [Spirochaetota bacterium]